MDETGGRAARTVMTRSSCICPSECGCFPSATSQREYRDRVQHVMLRTCGAGAPHWSDAIRGARPQTKARERSALLLSIMPWASGTAEATTQTCVRLTGAFRCYEHLNGRLRCHAARSASADMQQQAEGVVTEVYVVWTRCCAGVRVGYVAG